MAAAAVLVAGAVAARLGLAVPVRAEGRPTAVPGQPNRQLAGSC
jgi:hypothetical protein